MEARISPTALSQRELSALASLKTTLILCVLLDIGHKNLQRWRPPAVPSYVTTESPSHFFAIARCGSLFSEIREPSIHPLAHVLAAGIPFPSHLFHLPE